MAQTNYKGSPISHQAINILLVDDDDIDVEAVTRSFRKKKIANPIVIAKDGIEALEILRGENGRDKISRPYLILLDLNMPRMNGIEFLDEIRADTRLCKSIIFVLTTSSDDRDKYAAYKKNVAGYLIKSKAGSDFFAVIDMLDHYWRVVEFPPNGN